MTKKPVRDFLEKLKSLDSSSVSQEVIDAACEMADEVAEEEKKELEAKDECSTEKETEDACSKDECGECEKKTEDEETIEEKVNKAVSDAMSKFLRDSGLIKDKAMEAFDEELKGEEEEKKSEDAEGEESVTVDPEEIKSNDSAREILKEVKPYIANIKDEAARKTIADSFAKLSKMTAKAPVAEVKSASASTEYNFILNAVKSNKKNGVSDSQPQVNDYDVGFDIAKKYNPHYTKED